MLSISSTHNDPLIVVPAMVGLEIFIHGWDFSTPIHSENPIGMSTVGPIRKPLPGRRHAWQVTTL
jgi:hypothetical protein